MKACVGNNHIGNKNFDLGEQGNKAIYFRGTGEQVPPVRPHSWSISCGKGGTDTKKLPFSIYTWVKWIFKSHWITMYLCSIFPVWPKSSLISVYSSSPSSCCCSQSDPSRLVRSWCAGAGRRDISRSSASPFSSSRQFSRSRHLFQYSFFIANRPPISSSMSLHFISLSSAWKNTDGNSLTIRTKTMWMSNEPRHDKTHKMAVRPAKTQISLDIRPVWSESSQSAWRKLGSLANH